MHAYSYARFSLTPLLSVSLSLSLSLSVYMSILLSPGPEKDGWYAANWTRRDEIQSSLKDLTVGLLYFLKASN